MLQAHLYLLIFLVQNFKTIQVHDSNNNSIVSMISQNIATDDSFVFHSNTFFSKKYVITNVLISKFLLAFFISPLNKMKLNRTYCK